MKICIISNSHHTTDVRLYYKLARSLAKLGKVCLLSTSGVRNSTVNPYQVVVDAESNRYALVLLYKEAVKTKPDLVICVEPLTMFVGLALRRKLRCKVIFDVHEFFADAFAEKFPAPVSWLMKPLYLCFERWLQRMADGTIGVNDEILDQLIPSKQRDKAVTIPNYPVKNVWDYYCDMPGDLSTLCDMRFDLIYIGGLTADRGVFKMLKSIYLLKKDYPHLNVLILGRFFSQEVEKEFIRQITDWNLTAIVYHQKWLPAEKIGLLLKRSKVGLWLFNPQNRRMRKAVPLKVLEYYAAGLPVVSINTPLMRDLVEKNGLGFCCDYQSASIAKAVSKLLDMPAQDYQAMSDKAKALIEEHYNWEALEPRLFELITKLTDK